MVIILLIALGAFFWQSDLNDPKVELITTTVEIGEVKQVVSVSGVVEAKNTAELAFPVAGVVNSVLVFEGQAVAKGETLVKLDQAVLLAERDRVKAKIIRAEADLDELIFGARPEEREITSLSVVAAKKNIERVEREEEEKVKNTRQILLSDGLTAFSAEAEEAANPPTITGTYRCSESGEYKIQVFSSKTKSGYSYRLSGLENDTALVNINQSEPLGNCGLRISFSPQTKYNQTSWTVPVPNTSGQNYVANKGQLLLAEQQADNAIATAREALALAYQKQVLENSNPRSEALRRAEATVSETRAELRTIDARLSERTMTAPFDGVITDLDILPGEAVTAEPIITLLAEENFSITARLPEIDISKVAVGQSAKVVFDAKVGETLDAKISLISPIATEIDGVSYFKATLKLIHPPQWLRSGLNADVDIVTEVRQGVTRIPKRFLLTEADGKTTVLRRTAETAVTTLVEVIFTGNDGFVAISGLAEGTELIAP